MPAQLVKPLQRAQKCSILLKCNTFCFQRVVFYLQRIAKALLTFGETQSLFHGLLLVGLQGKGFLADLFMV